MRHKAQLLVQPAEPVRIQVPEPEVVRSAVRVHTQLQPVQHQRQLVRSVRLVLHPMLKVQHLHRHVRHAKLERMLLKVRLLARTVLPVTIRPTQVRAVVMPVRLVHIKMQPVKQAVYNVMPVHIMTRPLKLRPALVRFVRQVHIKRLKARAVVHNVMPVLITLIQVRQHLVLV